MIHWGRLCYIQAELISIGRKIIYRLYSPEEFTILAPTLT
jgi:hypothetical protein